MNSAIHVSFMFITCLTVTPLMLDDLVTVYHKFTNLAQCKVYTYSLILEDFRFSFKQWWGKPCARICTCTKEVEFTFGCAQQRFGSRHQQTLHYKIKRWSWQIAIGYTDDLLNCTVFVFYISYGFFLYRMTRLKLQKFWRIENCVMTVLLWIYLLVCSKQHWFVRNAANIK